MSSQIKSLKTFPSISAALTSIDLLDKAFLKTFKRKTQCDLTVAVLSSPFDRSKKRMIQGANSAEPAEVRVHYAKDAESEAQWFVDQIKSNLV